MPLRKEREFVYVGGSIPKIDPVENADFYLQLQKSMLLSLVNRKLLNMPQMERIMEKLEQQHFMNRTQTPS